MYNYIALYTKNTSKKNINQPNPRNNNNEEYTKIQLYT